MTRWLIHLLPMLLPFVLYGLYLWLVVRGGQGRRRVPWMWLTATGLLLMIASFILLGIFGGDPAGSDYSPARLLDGRVVPGEAR